MNEPWTAFVSFWSVQNTAVTLLQYPISWIELLGTLFNLASVILATRNRVAAWPVGLIGVILFFALFYQIRLYADVVEQAYYLVISFYGWWNWSKVARETDSTAGDPTIRFSALPSILGLLALGTVLSAVAGYLLTDIHKTLPTWFPEAAAYPYVDAATTVFSFIGTWLQARKRLECWIYWLIIDAVGVWLYWVKDVRFVAILFVLFLGLAAYGLVSWFKLCRAGNASLPESA